MGDALMRRNIAKVKTQCAVCDTSGGRVVVSLQEHEYPETTDDVFKMVECTNCGAMRLDPRPDISEINTIYPQSYFAYDLTSEASRNRWSPKAISMRREARRMSVLVQRHLGRTPHSVYDIGCGDGATLDLMKTIFGPETRTEGCEVNQIAAMRAAEMGHVVQNALFESCTIGEKRYDLIVTSHVIEHVASPLEFLRHAANMMTDESILVVDTPNTANPVRRLFGRHWGGWHTPRHWNLFDPRSFEELAHRADLQIVGISQMTINMFWVWSMHSVLYGKFRRAADKYFNPRTTINGGLVALVALVVFQGLDRGFLLCSRQAGQMRVVMRRRPAT